MPVRRQGPVNRVNQAASPVAIQVRLQRVVGIRVASLGDLDEPGAGDFCVVSAAELPAGVEFPQLLDRQVGRQAVDKMDASLRTPVVDYDISKFRLPVSPRLRRRLRSIAECRDSGLP